MRYSDHPNINHDVEMLLWYFGDSPFVAVGQMPPPAMTRAEVIDTVRDMYGARAARSVQINIH